MDQETYLWELLAGRSYFPLNITVMGQLAALTMQAMWMSHQYCWHGLTENNHKIFPLYHLSFVGCKIHLFTVFWTVSFVNFHVFTTIPILTHMYFQY